MALRGGDTFQAADRKREAHLWIVLSDPEKHPEAPVLIANVTTRRADSDTACTLARGDHPFIRHVCSLRNLQLLKDRGLAE